MQAPGLFFRPRSLPVLVIHDLPPVRAAFARGPFCPEEWQDICCSRHMNISDSFASSPFLQAANMRISSSEAKLAKVESREKRREEDLRFEEAMIEQDRREVVSEPPTRPVAADDDTRVATEAEPPTDKETPGSATSEPETGEATSSEEAPKTGMENDKIDQQALSQKVLSTQMGEPLSGEQALPNLLGKETGAGKPVAETAPSSQAAPSLGEQFQTKAAESASVQATQPAPAWMDGPQPDSASGETVPHHEANLHKKGLEKSLLNSMAQNGSELNLPLSTQSVAADIPINAVSASQSIPGWQNVQINPAEIVDQVKIHILQGSKNGEKKITLHLQPPELGKLNIELSLSDKQIEARIYTEHQVVREVVLSQLEQLRAQLAQEGWNLGRVDVNIGTFREQHNQRTQNEMLSFATGQGRSGGTAAVDPNTPDSPQRIWQPPGIGRRINMIV